MPAKQKHHTVRFEMLLTPELAEHWEALAESNGISKAELVRRRMAGYRIKSIPQVNWKCYWQLLKISENIDQIAKTQNAATIQGVNPPPINYVSFEELKIEISKLRLQLILGNDEATENELKTAIIEK
jgi:hypothetical protein